jgi:hypothetical protein
MGIFNYFKKSAKCCKEGEFFAGTMQKSSRGRAAI